MKPITTTAELAAFCNELQGQPFVAVDTEFMRETTYWPKLCLIQVGVPQRRGRHRSAGGRSGPDAAAGS
jgi:ribonuclease D